MAAPTPSDTPLPHSYEMRSAEQSLAGVFLFLRYTLAFVVGMRSDGVLQSSD